MTKYLTGRFKKILMLLVGVCLIGTAFHVHQLHPDYSLQDSNIPHHLSVDQPDCVACMNLLQGLPLVDGSTNPVRHESAQISLFTDRFSPVDNVFHLNNKSPPAIC